MATLSNAAMPVRIAAMLTRALIVLLLALNVGVAAWWALRPAPQPAAIVQIDGVGRLQLLSEATSQSGRRAPVLVPLPDVSNGSDTTNRLAATASTPVDASAPNTDATVKALGSKADAVAPALASATPDTAAKPICFSFGPFASVDAANAANARLLPLVRRAAVRTRIAGPVRGWRVVVPPLTSQDAAKVMAKRIADAGFSDYLVMHDGADANAIALGRYGSETIARRRVQTLAAAGIAARAEPVGGGPSTTWLDVLAAPGFDATHAQSVATAPGRETLDCARLR